MAWTDEQLAAMQKNSGNLLVSAGAGSGKTAVLIERIIGIITDEAQPVDVDELLVLTYTNAAAAEMRRRLMLALRARLEDDPENVHLNRQLVLVQRARIMTLHSFCLDMLREYGYLLDIDPKSRIANEGELAILREQTLEQVFELAYAEENSGLKLLLAHYSRGIGDDIIRRLVLRLVDFARSMPDVEDWLAGLARPYRGQPQVWLDYFAECMRVDAVELLDMAMAVESLAERSEGLEKYLPVLRQDRAGLMQAAEVLWRGDMPGFLQRLAAAEFGRLPALRARDGYDAAVKEKLGVLRKQLKEARAAMLQSAMPLINGTLAAENESVRPLAEALSALALVYHQAWQAAKKRRRMLEFADLEHYALALLRDDALGVAGRMQESFFEIMVDEYQDVNEVQETILQLLTNGSNRFMVGDIKQSIYRFRLAEPGLFLHKAAAYGAADGGRRIDLNRNFRSQGNILDGVNFVFSRLMSGGNLEIVYDDTAMLRCGRTEPERRQNELLILDCGALRGGAAADDDTAAEGTADANWLEDMQTAELEANLIAARIRQELAEGRQPGEIVVLLRSVRTWSPIFGQVFRLHDIPCYADGTEQFLSLPEVQTVCNLLAVLDNPRQDIPLAALLHSPLVGLKLAELADLHILDRACLYDGLKQSHDARSVRLLLRLDVWRQKSRELGMAELLEYLYNDTALPELLGGLAGGALRRRSLNVIARLAAEYDAAGGVGVGGFLRFVEAAGKETGRVADAGGDGDFVRIMSIHKSKGLEFPVVFIAGLGTRFNEEDFRQDILLHRSLGLGMRRVDLDRRCKYPTFGYNIIARKSRWEALAESLRILYVAMTRAEDKLYLVGSVKSAAAFGRMLAALPEERDSDAVPAGFLEKNRNFLAWVSAALLLHSDAGLLRHLAGWQGMTAAELPGAGSGWRVELVDRLQRPVAADGQTAFDLDEWLGDPAADAAPEIAAMLQREYPQAELARLPVKWSVSALQRLEALPVGEAADEAAAAAEAAEDFAEELAAAGHADGYPGGKTPAWYAEYGTLVHKMLEQADLSVLRGGADAAEHLADISRRVSEGFAADVAAVVRPQDVARFFASELGRRLLALPQDAPVLREQRFIAGLTLAELAELDADVAGRLAAASGLQAGEHTGEILFMQGVIDLTFREDDGWVLVDYKSGGNDTKSDDDIRRQYALQLAVYRSAMHKALGSRVKAGYIYFTANDRTVRIF